MISEPGNGVDVGLELFLVDMLELEVVPEHGLQGEAIEFLLGEKFSQNLNDLPKYCPLFLFFLTSYPVRNSK